MTDLDRNTRTLIMSFAVAMFALVPLRFIEVGQQVTDMSGTMVLGTQESVEQEVTDYQSEARLEAPYNEIDGPVLGASIESSEEVMVEESVNCINADEASAIIEDMYNSGASSEDMQLVANSVCQ